jgi:hypothetical protein
VRDLEGATQPGQVQETGEPSGRVPGHEGATPVTGGVAQPYQRASPVASRNVTPSRSSHSSGQPSDFSAGRQVATNWPALAKSGSPLTRNTAASLSKTRGETRTVSGGSSRLVRRCASSGVPSWDRAGLPCGRHTLASRQLRRRVRARKVQTRVSTAADGAPAPGRLVSPARPCDAARTGSNAARRRASAQWMCRPDASLPPGVPGRPHGP